MLQKRLERSVTIMVTRQQQILTILIENIVLDTQLVTFSLKK